MNGCVQSHQGAPSTIFVAPHELPLIASSTTQVACVKRYLNADQKKVLRVVMKVSENNGDLYVEGVATEGSVSMPSAQNVSLYHFAMINALSRYLYFLTDGSEAALRQRLAWAILDYSSVNHKDQKKALSDIEFVQSKIAQHEFIAARDKYCALLDDDPGKKAAETARDNALKTTLAYQ
jgi:hypothetical protein